MKTKNEAFLRSLSVLPILECMDFAVYLEFLNRCLERFFLLLWTSVLRYPTVHSVVRRRWIGVPFFHLNIPVRLIRHTFWIFITRKVEILQMIAFNSINTMLYFTHSSLWPLRNCDFKIEISTKTIVLSWGLGVK